MRLIASLIVAIACIGCGVPEKYAMPGVLELDVLNSLTVLFVSPEQGVTPVRNLRIVTNGDYAIGRCFWEEWTPVGGDENRGVYVMSRATATIFACNEKSARDSIRASDAMLHAVSPMASRMVR